MGQPRYIDFETYAAEHFATQAQLEAKRVRLRVAYDALVSVGVIVAGGLIFLTHWTWLDPAMSIVVVAVIVYGACVLKKLKSVSYL